jgi:hypothetical protein
MNDLAQLRKEACSAVATLYKNAGTRRGQKRVLERLARLLNRSVRTLRRWERNPAVDPLVEYAYRYLAGHIFGWTGWQVSLKHDHIRLWQNSVSYLSVPRQRIEGFDYSERIQQQLIRALQKKIETLEAELEAIKTSMLSDGHAESDGRMY